MLYYGCATLIISVKPAKYTRDEHFWLRYYQYMREVICTFATVMVTPPSGRTSPPNIGEMDLMWYVSLQPTCLCELLVISYADGA